MPTVRVERPAGETDPGTPTRCVQRRREMVIEGPQQRHPSTTAHGQPTSTQRACSPSLLPFPLPRRHTPPLPTPLPTPSAYDTARRLAGETLTLEEDAYRWGGEGYVRDPLACLGHLLGHLFLPRLAGETSTLEEDAYRWGGEGGQDVYRWKGGMAA